jgi:hypothetical protein
MINRASVVTAIIKRQQVGELDWTHIETVIRTALEAEHQEGIDEGRATQAMLELQGRERFMAELRDGQPST